MTNPFLIFCLGFVCGAIPFLAVIVAYYIRARRRVNSIKAKIAQLHQAQETVHNACEKAYGGGHE